MVNECLKFKTSRDGLLEIDSAHLDAFFRRIVPDEQFRFIIFQQTDFRRRNLTFMLFNYLPNTVYVTVERASDLDASPEELVALNPGVYREYGTLNCFDMPDNNGHYYITTELSLTVVPMRISREGVLIGKWQSY